MRPVALRIANFRGFQKEQEFVFAGRPGLFFMQGANEAEPRLGSNGAGKSTVWDALCWVLFARTPRGLKAGDVCNWAAGKGARVELDVLIGEDPRPATVTRTWGPISWTLKDGDSGEVFDLVKEADNPVIMGLHGLRLELEPFLSSVLLAQQQPMFLDLKPGPQAELFSSVMRLDGWLRRADRASARASDQDAATRRAERALAAAEGEVAALERNGPDRARQWEEERAGRLFKLGSAYEEALNLDDSLADLKHAEEAVMNARAAVHVSAPSPADEKRWGQLRADVSDNQMMLRDAERDAERAQAELEALELDEPCPTCGGRLPKGEWQAAVRSAGKRLEKRRADVELRASALEHARAEQAEAQLLEDAAESAYAEARADLDALQGKLDAAKDTRAEMVRYFEGLERDAARIEAEANPYAGDAGALGDARARRDAARAEVGESERRRSLYNFWVRGFKDVRLGLIAEALAELEVEANSACESLGLVGWELSFAVDRETRSGGVQRGFSVGVRSPHSVRAAPWEAWSGGEGQRLRVAAQCGLADLVRARTGADFPVEVWDEPTAGMSPQGVDDLLAALRARAFAEGREIWVVDHRSHAFGGFDGGATVVKAPSGSRIRMAV